MIKLYALLAIMTHANGAPDDTFVVDYALTWQECQYAQIGLQDIMADNIELTCKLDIYSGGSAMTYRPRGMPARFMVGAPDIVKSNVIDIIAIVPAAPLDFDIVFRPEPDASEIVGLDFDKYGAQGCHFFLKPHQMTAYRGRNRRKRVAWLDLPEKTKSRIVNYLEEDA